MTKRKKTAPKLPPALRRWLARPLPAVAARVRALVVYRLTRYEGAHQ